MTYWYRPGTKTVRAPDLPDLDPAVRALLDRVLSGDVPWARVDPGVRKWCYRPPIAASITLVRRNLQYLGLDLAVVPYEEVEP